ncbi:MAG: ribonuclease HII [Candidatus Paceibacterota bacterium]
MKSPVGIDEVGRGPVAGPLYLCALKLSKKSSFYEACDIRDSKKLTQTSRQAIYETLKKEKKEGKVHYALASVTAKKIDAIGMSRALKLAVLKVIKKMNLSSSDPILLDGSLVAPTIYTNQKTIIKGDETEISIALASIVAKVTRDRRMEQYSKKWPQYGFEKHKGYGTWAHYTAINQHGLTEIHRISFLKNTP